MSQVIIEGNSAIKQIGDILKEQNIKKYMLVCDSSFGFLGVEDIFGSFDAECVKFDSFTPNPLYEDVVKGVDLFNNEGCEAIVAVGGGSTLDVAKCIKLYSKMDKSVNYLRQEYKDTGVPLIAAPTTAGTGSESTRFAVIYFEGQKQSVAHESIVPNYAVLNSAFLKTLPLYQKKCTLMDAFCQAIESMWSVNSTDESKEFSQKAINLITENMADYINNNSPEVNSKIMLAANYAGRAINITQTTAAHAMSYKITSLYSLPHGHAVAVCLPQVWEYMNSHMDKCIDHRGEMYLKDVFETLVGLLGCDSVSEAIDKFNGYLKALELDNPKANDRAQELEILSASVNPVRLKNNPVELDSQTLKNLYERILK